MGNIMLVQSLIESHERFQNAKAHAVAMGNVLIEHFRTLPIHTRLRMGRGKASVVFVVTGHNEGRIQYRLDINEVSRYFGKKFPNLLLVKVTAFRLPGECTWHNFAKE